ncbi:MAG: hypothetical protein HAW60_01555 [Bdellovibrionales bacterium]|nr:hypothetical protein [Bdellovibrionales bacterium]
MPLVAYKNFCNILKKLSIYSLLSFFSLSCALVPSNPFDTAVKQKVKKTFKENYDILWKIAQQSAQKYPIKKTDYEKGLIFTRWIRLNSIFKDPSVKTTKSFYQIRIYITKHLDNKTSTIKIEKQIKSKKNFLSEEVNILSNQVEEKIILYRIVQELKIYKKLNTTL